MRDASRFFPLPYPRVRLALAWATALLAGAIALYYAWALSFAHERRRDGNNGHTTIDFGAQWLMGRMIVAGEGQRLYDRDALRAMLERSFPVADQAPVREGEDPSPTDAEMLLSSLMRGDDTDVPARVTGPLYPPVQALLYAPLGMLSPQAGYRTMQTLNLVLVFAVGWLVQQLTRGRVWWPVASVLIMLLPGYAGSINLGQNAAVTLFLLTFGWWLMTRGRPVLGGVVWGLLAFKPVWAAAFLPVLLLSGRWRMALTMAATGAVLVLATLPLVGVHGWLNWLSLGRIAAALYERDESWIVLSRDLQGVVRRWFLPVTYEWLPWRLFAAHQPKPATNSPEASRLAIGVWLAVALVTVVVALSCRRVIRQHDGPGAAFPLLGGWFGCFHFMYYDTILVALPLALLFARADTRKRVPAVVLALLIATYYLSAWIDRSYHFPQWDTYLLLALWAWCGCTVWQLSRAGAEVKRDERGEHHVETDTDAQVGIHVGIDKDANDK